MSERPVYIATVCLDANRWGSRQPSFAVSDWLDRFEADGFDGVELWAFHYTRTETAEQQRLAERAAPLEIYNVYCNFADDPEHAEARAAAAEAATALQARAVKYNIGHDRQQIDAYRRNVLAWADQLPTNCRLLCECHPGTLLETVEQAGAFFKGLDPRRFGIIAHLMDDPAALKAWLDAFGPRVQHIHIQRRSPETDPNTDQGRVSMAACVAVLKAGGFDGSASIEFTRGIGKDEQLEQIYANALADRDCYREAWS